MRRSVRSARVLLALVVATVTLVATTAMPASAAPTVGLGAAAPFAILGGADITNVHTSTINGDIGISPGTLGMITDYDAPTVHNGTKYAEPDANAAKAALVTAYDDAAGRGPATAILGDTLGGKTLVAGAHSGDALLLTGTVTLDGENDPDAVFVIQAASSLTTASGSEVVLTRGAQACNVFWKVGSSATIGSTTKFKGTILALTAISVQSGAVIEGRLLARNAGVTLIQDTVTVPTCAPPVTTTTPTTPTTLAPVFVPAPTTTTSTTVRPARTTTTTTTAPTTTTTGAPTTTTTAVTVPPVDVTIPPTPTTVAGVVATGAGSGVGFGGGSGTGSGHPGDGSGHPGDGSSSTGVGAPSRPTLPRTGAPLVPFALAGVASLVACVSLVRRSERLPRHEPQHVRGR